MADTRWKNRESPTVEGFVGRRDALERFDSLSEPPARMVTICGPPGVGKTTLTRKLQSGRLRERFGDDVCFCSLEDARDTHDIVVRVADALGLALDAHTADEEAAERVAHRLESASTALILDNFEHVVEPGRDLLCRWIDRLGDSLLIITSRQPVGMREESLLDLHPLSLDEASELYRQRASRSHAEGFDVVDADIETLVERLEGLPLAVELAAAQWPVIGPGELLDRWDHLFDMLRRPSEGLAGGDSPLSVAIEGSWRLLTDEEQSTLVQLTIFQEEFSLQAAEEVVELDDAGPSAVALLIRQLHDKSLLRFVSRTADGPKFALYVSVREYVRTHQCESFPDPLQRRFVDFYERFVRHFHVDCREAETRDRLERFFDEESNIRAAIEHAADCAPLKAPPIAWGMSRLSLFYRPLQSAEDLVDRLQGVLDKLEDSPEKRRAEAILCMTLAVPIQWSLSDPDYSGWDALNRGLELADPEDDADVRADLLMAKNSVYSPKPVENGYDKRKEFLREAIEAARRTENDGLLCTALRTLGALHSSHREFEESRTCIARSLRIADREELINAKFSANIYLGQSASIFGRLEEAARHLEKARALEDRVGNQPLVVVGTYVFGDVLVLLGDLERAEAKLSAVVPRLRHLNFTYYVPPALVSRGLLEMKRDRFDDAARHFEEALDICHTHDFDTHEFDVRCMSAMLEYLRDRPNRARTHRQRAATLAETFERRIGQQPLDMLEAFRQAIDGGRALSNGDVPAARQHVDAARQAVADFRSRTSVGPEDGDAEPVKRSSQRIALMVDWAVEPIEETLPDDAPTDDADALLVAPDGSWLRPPGGETIDLSRRGAIRRILAELAQLRASDAKGAYDVYDLLEIGWPDEDILPDSGRSRVYTTVNALREFGLDGILITSDEGYLLDPDLPLRIRDEPPTD